VEKSTIQPHNKFGTFQMASYIPHLIIPDCDHVLFEKTALANPHSFYRMNLIQGQLEIMPPNPVHNETDQRESIIIAEVVNWCLANEDLVGHHGGSQEGMSIDPIANPPTVRIYSFDADTSSVVWQEFVNPQTLELLRQRVTKLETENTKLKQIIEEIANLRIENTRLKQIIKQNRTTNDASQLPIPSHINGHSDENGSTDSLNLEQVQSDISPEINSNNTPKQVENTSDDASNPDIYARNKESIQKTSAESEQMSIDQTHNTISPEIKIPYDQKVERGLMHELSVCVKENLTIQEINVQIPDLPLEKILIGSDEVTAQIISLQNIIFQNNDT
ncbi:4870_t:CDS:2, partial [Racocetra fulgida]